MTTDIDSPSMGERPELVSNSHQSNPQTQLSINSATFTSADSRNSLSPLSAPDPPPAPNTATTSEKPRDSLQTTETGYTSGSNSDSAGKSVIFKKPKPITSTSINKVFLNKAVTSSSSPSQSQTSGLKKSGAQISQSLPKSSFASPTTTSWGSSAKSRLATKISNSQAAKRENSSSPKPLDGRHGGSKGSAAADSVWNRGKAPEEIDMSTIHMAARLESRDKDTAGWDEIDDDDDDWADTIDFGDGTKITITHEDPASSDQTVPGEPQSAQPGTQSASTPTSASTKAATSPWKPISAPEPASIPVQAPITLHPVSHTERFSEDMFDRSWRHKGPPAATRSIFNANTGKFEQVDESSIKVRTRQASRGSTRELPPKNRIPSDSNTSDRGNRSGRRASNASSRHASVNADDLSFVLKSSPTVSHAVPVFDQSPIEPQVDIETIQNSIMLDTRERARKRKEEELAAESARMQRTKQKAEELAKKSEASKAEKLEKEKLDKDRAATQTASPRKVLPRSSPTRPTVVIPTSSEDIQPEKDSPRKRAAGFRTTSAKTKLVTVSKFQPVEPSLLPPSIPWRSSSQTAGPSGSKAPDSILQRQKPISSSPPPLQKPSSNSSFDDRQSLSDFSRKTPTALMESDLGSTTNPRKQKCAKARSPVQPDRMNAWNAYASNIQREEQIAKDRTVPENRKDSVVNVKSINQPRLQNNWRKVHILENGERSYGENVVKVIDPKKDSPVKQGDAHPAYNPSSRSTSRYFPSESAKSAISAHLGLDLKRNSSKTADEHPQDPATKIELTSSTLSTIVKLPPAGREALHGGISHFSPTLTPPSSPSKSLHGSPRYAHPSMSSFTSTMQRIKERMHYRPANPKPRAASPETSLNEATVSPSLTFSAPSSIAVKMPSIRLVNHCKMKELDSWNLHMRIDFPVEQAVVNIPEDKRKLHVSNFEFGICYPKEAADLLPLSRDELLFQVFPMASQLQIQIPGMPEPIKICKPRLQIHKRSFLGKRGGRKGPNSSRAEDGPWRKESPIVDSPN
ncbi:hypothetical protein NEOLI_003281 [Neolecta irregularis DAH-3]|uniref:Uncharacterized protein n=1 Tax=Neolecta irregularis (strain DAH-3) TaxID=1198029 RepID=A0A1U7LKE3_NEOID|nr:hypothetical protein NEOLI_003281 [Neolecta irregularis DAH-3]|eukprot:OLL23063.1 hypothetical protein NEOLI_003281 [Neolecta irregularis DAH-3]